jgi:CheY-like chemotaxis protein
MGGTIFAKSEKEKGSEFYFSVFYEKAPKDLIKTIKDKNVIVGIEHKHFHNTALVVDEIEENRRLLVQMLNYYGIKTYEARDGLEVLYIYKKEKIDLIFMDILMPKLDGIKTIRKIRVDDKEIPIVVVSANVFSEDRKNALDNGANDFICKPIEESELLLILEKYINASLIYNKKISKDLPADYSKVNKELLNELIIYCNNMDNEKIQELLENKQLEKEFIDDVKTKIEEFKYHEIIKLCKSSSKE